MKEIKLGQVAEISSGLVLQRFGTERKYSTPPRSLDPNKGGKNYYHTTLKAVDDNKINKNLLESIKVEKEINKRYLLKRGDIIMKLSPPFSAAVIDFDCTNLIGTSHFAIIRVNREFDPVYLSYILNGKFVRRQLSKVIEGGVLSIIKINYLNEVKIRMRDINEQLKYGKLFSLLSKRRELKNRVIDIEEEIIGEIIAGL